MKICIFGAGAIGGYLGALLARAGQEISLIARGAHREAIVAEGLQLQLAGETIRCELPCVENPAELGPQDFVIVTLKAHSVSAVAASMKPLLGPNTGVVFAVNGVPWWYFYGLDGPYVNRQLASVDPDGAQWQEIGPERAIGCVVYPAAEVVEPGVVAHIEGDRFTLGEPNGEKSSRIVALAEALRDAGLKAPIKSRIRDEIWIKLWGNLSFNPISALTGATLEAICADTGTRSLARSMMLEAQAIGEALGIRFAVNVEKRINGAQAVGAHKTSMLQDLERGRTLELEALVGAVTELGRLTEIPTPTIDAVLALARLRSGQTLD
ncbi:MAG: 2-dehydropantoate 2-reductase [Pseudomonadota bacterium]